MRGTRFTVAVLSASALFGLSSMFLVVGASEAMAKGGHFVIPASKTAEFRLKGSNGVSIAVSGSGRQVSLTARKGGLSASYSARGFVSSDRMKTRLGNLGRVSVHFHPSQPPHRMPQPEGNCKGPDDVVQPGRFIGTIAFEGEQGYTIVHASRAMGKVTFSAKQTCKKASGEGRGKPPVRFTLLTASATEVGLFAFRAMSKTHPALNAAAFSASVFESLHGLAIVRMVNASDEVGSFSTVNSGGQIMSATLSPPLPFTGSATYEKQKGSPATWTGTLAGEFLGRGEVSLAGPQFTAEISEATG